MVSVSASGFARVPASAAPDACHDDGDLAASDVGEQVGAGAVAHSICERLPQCGSCGVVRGAVRKVRPSARKAWPAASRRVAATLPAPCSSGSGGSSSAPAGATKLSSRLGRHRGRDHFDHVAAAQFGTKCTGSPLTWPPHSGRPRRSGWRRPKSTGVARRKRMISTWA